MVRGRPKTGERVQLCGLLRGGEHPRSGAALRKSCAVTPSRVSNCCALYPAIPPKELLYRLGMLSAKGFSNIEWRAMCLRLYLTNKLVQKILKL
jgi:hypothetical protein